MLAVDPAEAQQVRARVVAHPGLAVKPPTEPAIGAGEHAILVLFFSPAYQYADWHKSFYASRRVDGTRWARHPIDGPYEDVGDVSVAYDGATGGFLTAGMADTTHLATCRFEPGTTTGELIPGTWTQVALDPEMGAVDKPWMLAGSHTLPGGQEYYIVYGLSGKYYLHSTNGGETWHQGPIAVDGQNIDGAWGAQPAIHAVGPLYVANISGGEIRFIVGEDQPDGTVDFAYLLQSVDPPVPVSISLREELVYDELPGDFPQRVGARIPYLAVDPSDPNRLYVAYHDVHQNDDTDVNIYLNRLTKNGMSGQRPIRSRSTMTRRSLKVTSSRLSSPWMTRAGSTSSSTTTGGSTSCRIRPTARRTPISMCTTPTASTRGRPGSTSGSS
jgi:hypothetical protein